MFCPKCGSKHQKGAIFCRNCGKRLGDNGAERIVAPQRSQAGVYPNAAWGKRLTNYIIDTVTIYALIFVTGIVISLFDSNFSYSEDSVFSLLTVIVYVIYYSGCEYLWGKTLGKIVTQTRVLHNEGENINYWTTLKRSLIRFVPLEALSLDSRTRIMWHDKWSNTRVVDETKVVDPDELEAPPTVKKPWGYGLLKIVSIYTLWIILISAVLAFLLGKYGASIFNMVLGACGVVGFIWLLVGLPLGLIEMTRKNGNNGYDGERNAAVLLGGLVILGMVFCAYALVYILAALTGIDLVGNSI